MTEHGRTIIDKLIIEKAQQHSSVSISDLNRQLKALFKFDYLAKSETQSMHWLVQKLKAGEWVKKEKQEEIITQYVINTEKMMKDFMHIALMFKVEGDGYKGLMQSLDYAMTQVDDEIGQRIDKLQDELIASGKMKESDRT